MRISSDLVVAVLVCGLAVGAHVNRASAAGQGVTSDSPRVDDGSIQDRIEAGLKANTLLAPRNIDVDVDKGVVTLTGTVRTADEKAAARRIADVRGVVRVRNRIEVDPKVDESKIDAAAEKTKTGLTKAVDATVTAAKKSREAVQKGVGKAEQGAGKAADKTSDTLGKAGAKATDASITSGVKAAFYDEKVLQDTAIDVDTTAQVVTLRGTVHSDAAKMRAEEIALRTEGVTSVVNELVVKVN
jgi:hyperosmotically inducible protein